MSRDRSTRYFVKTSGNWKQVQAEKTNHFPCPEENSALGIQLDSLVIKCSSTEIAHVLSYEDSAQSQDIHYWCQSQKIMPVMPVGRRKISVFSLYLDLLGGTKESASTTGQETQKHHWNLQEKRRVSGQKKARMESKTLILWFCPWQWLSLSTTTRILII